MPQNSPENRLEIPVVLPVLSMRGGVMFPGMVVPVMLTTERSQALVDVALKTKREPIFIAAVTQTDESVELPAPKDLYDVGITCIISKMARGPDGTVRVLLHGISRVKVKRYIQTEPFFVAEVENVEERPSPTDESTKAARRAVLEMFEEIASSSPYLKDEHVAAAGSIEGLGRLADFVTAYMNFSVPQKQKVLETFDPVERMKLVVPLLQGELNVARISQKIRRSAADEIDKGQKEYVLREQLKAIQRELGMNAEANELERLNARIEEAKLPKEALTVSKREAARLANIQQGSPEYTVIVNYLDWILSLPWDAMTEDNLDIRRVKRVLDEDHFDLDDVKTRIVEHLSVSKLKPDARGPILCFVGPPGVGKTSLGKSIARALGRKFVRLSLGGVRDEAEIRGHRRTYIGAIPGNVITNLRRVETRNPVFMLDEIDKLGSDFRGDPSSALLEVLDPEQNFSFRDHYIEVAFDLSQVMFITTANTTASIPPPLLDRMEQVELPGYVSEEKAIIAKRYLLRREEEAVGLPPKTLRVSGAALTTIISQYTRESGVRELARKLGTIARKVAVKHASGDKGPVSVKRDNVREFLGPPVYYSEVAEMQGKVGVATGLAWTPAGGEILFVESRKMPGKGTLKLTGHLGDVMRESAEAALSLIKSSAERFEVDPHLFERMDFHVHVPAGATPKDGPSAGVAIFVSLLSTLLDRPVKPEVGMTGEITLSGRVLPIGGVKEKVIAASRANLKRVLLPAWNEKDLQDLPDYVRRGLEFGFVKNVFGVPPDALNA